MTTVALGQAWPRHEYEQLFTEATTAYPDYYVFSIKKACFLLPRWYGATGEWQQFARSAGKSVGPDVLARICWANGGIEGYDKLFTTNGIGWEEIEPGFVELLRKNPRSAWVLNFYCRLACAAKQREVAARLFEEIGQDYYAEAWLSKKNYDENRLWASTTVR